MSIIYWWNKEYKVWTLCAHRVLLIEYRAPGIRVFNNRIHMWYVIFMYVRLLLWLYVPLYITLCNIYVPFRMYTSIILVRNTSLDRDNCALADLHKYRGIIIRASTFSKIHREIDQKAIPTAVKQCCDATCILCVCE